MNGENLLTVISVRQIKRYSPIKASRAQKSGVKHVRTVSRRHNYHLFIRFETIELDQNLIECLFALIIPSPHTRTTHSSHGIYFVHEDNSRRSLLGQAEKIAH